MSISSISINVDGKDFRISKDDSKDVTKDFTKDHTREISKETNREPKNTTFDDDVVNYHISNINLYKNESLFFEKYI